MCHQWCHNAKSEGKLGRDNEHVQESVNLSQGIFNETLAILTGLASVTILIL